MRILYGVMCEGMGHAIRSSVVRDHLVSKNHDVTFACGNSRASKYLTKYGPVARTPCFSTGTKNGRFSPIEAIKNLPNVAMLNLSPLLLAGLPRPDVVITDFEPCTARYATTWGIPLICIDNLHFMDRCSHPATIASDTKRAFSDILVTRGVAPGAAHYMVTSFVNAPIRLPRTSLHLPILRPSTIQACSAANADHVVVYFNDLADWSSIIGTLEKCDGQFHCYGSPADGVVRKANVTLLPMSDAFLQDLACAKAVIAGGGFTLMTECIYSHKPMLCMPYFHNFEQGLNGRYLEALGFGICCSELTPALVDDFLQRCPEFEENLEPISHDSNSGLFSALDRMLGC